MTIMGEILAWPLEKRSEDGMSRGVSIGFAAASVAVAVIVAAITGTWITATVMAGTDARLSSYSDMLKRDHDETRQHIDNLTGDIRAIGNTAASQAAQIEALRRALEQERADRLQEEQRWYGRQK